MGLVLHLLQMMRHIKILLQLHIRFILHSSWMWLHRSTLLVPLLDKVLSLSTWTYFVKLVGRCSLVTVIIVLLICLDGTLAKLMPRLQVLTLSVQ